MQSSDNVVNRIIDLDALAERIRARAREDAETLRAETRRSMADGKTQLESRISDRIAQIEAEAVRKRSVEIEAVHKDYASQAKAVESIAPDRMARVADLVLSRIKGSSE